MTRRVIFLGHALQRHDHQLYVRFLESVAEPRHTGRGNRQLHVHGHGQASHDDGRERDHDLRIRQHGPAHVESHAGGNAELHLRCGGPPGVHRFEPHQWRIGLLYLRHPEPAEHGRRHPLGGSNTTTYTYDSANNLATATYPNGVETTFTYDTLNRVTGLASQLGNYTYALARPATAPARPSRTAAP